MNTAESVMPMEDRHISSSLIEKILAVKNNSLVPRFFEVYKTVATGKGIKNVTVNRRGEMTFLPKGKESVLDTATYPNVWKKTNRQEGSFGKVLRKLLIENGSSEVNPSELEEIVNVLKGHYTVEGIFTMVSGADISYYYLDDNYDYSGFNLGSMECSCMRYGGSCQTATEVYADNPDTCEMLILKHPEKDVSRARALIWTDVNGDKWMDRVYSCDHIVKAFHNYARSNGWGHKVDQDACDGHWVDQNGDQDNHKIKVKMNLHHEIVPYMDSLYYYYNGFIANNDSYGTYNRYAQTEPDEQEDNEWDGYDDCYIDRDDAVYLDYRDYYTASCNVTYCSITDEYYLTDDCIQLHDGSMAWEDCDDVVYLDSEGDYYHRDDLTFCDYNNEDYPEERVEYVDDLGMNVYEPSINNAYEDAGWVQDEDGDWVESQHEMEF